jgi:hypothetical protein
MKWIDLKNEKGIALIVALMILLVLTLLGISSINTSTYETSLAGNQRIGTDAFYAAEAGLQVAFNQLPLATAVPVTSLGTDASYWTGSPADKGAPKAPESKGLYHKPGFDISSYAFRRYKINASGDSFGATKEIEAQASYGPFSSGTGYNN